MPIGLEKMQSVMVLNSKGYVNSRESATVEFKESFNWNNRAEYAKIMVAFANNQGGIIVFGVKNKPKNPIGLQSDKFENREPENISEYLKSKFSTPIQFESEIYEFEAKNFGYIYVEQAKIRPVICTKDDGIELKDGDIYFRNGARSERIDSMNLQRLIEEEREKERTRWKEIFERVSQVGVENATILNLQTGEISDKGGTVVIDESILPQLKFIKEGQFSEKEGAPTLKLIGEVTSSAQIIEKEVDKYKDWLFTKEIGKNLGFPDKNAMPNALALIKYYSFQIPKYMKEEKNLSGQSIKKYSPEVLTILLHKKESGEFSDDPNSEVMKNIRKESHKK